MTFQTASRAIQRFPLGASVVIRGWRQRFCSVQGALLLGSLVAFTGCTTAYTLPPLVPSHPAHLEAATPAARPVSNTLAYRPSDLPSPQPRFAERQTHAPTSQVGKTAVVGEGKVIATVPNSQQIVIDHQEIKGFMDAMTMGYRVDPPSILEGLNVGDHIRFTIDAQQNAIIQIEKLNP
jgi:Cu/Ag efflux protein CusF